MMRLIENQLDGHYDNLELAQSALKKAGFYDFHAGNWRHIRKPGVTRDIRKQDGKFVIYEWSYQSI